MTKGEQTRREILAKVAPLFNQKGFAGTAMSAVLSATGLQKGGVYRHFANKEELAAAAFDYAVADLARARFEGVNPDDHAVDQLKRHIDNFVHPPAHLAGGCPILNTAVDADDGNKLLRSRVKKVMQRWVDRLASILRLGIVRGEVVKSVQPEELATLMVASLEGALIMSRILGSQTPTQQAGEHLNALLESIRRR